MTSQQFVDAFATRYNGAEPSQSGASMFASLCALASAIEAAGTLNTSAVAAELRRLRLAEFYGPPHPHAEWLPRRRLPPATA